MDTQAAIDLITFLILAAVGVLVAVVLQDALQDFVMAFARIR